MGSPPTTAAADLIPINKTHRNDHKLDQLVSTVRCHRQQKFHQNGFNRRALRFYSKIRLHQSKLIYSYYYSHQFVLIPINLLHQLFENGDDKPLSICNDCVKFVIDIEKFAIQCIKIDEMFGEIINETTISNGNITADINLIRTKYGLLVDENHPQDTLFLDDIKPQFIKQESNENFLFVEVITTDEQSQTTTATLSGDSTTIRPSIKKKVSTKRTTQETSPAAKDATNKTSPNKKQPIDSTDDDDNKSSATRIKLKTTTKAPKAYSRL